MKRTTCILLAALVLATLVPAALAAPIVEVAVGTFWYEWNTGTTAGECRSPSDTIAFEAQQVNSRLLLSIASGRGRAHQNVFNLQPAAMLPDANCPLQVTAAPGVYVNPCAVLAGQVSTPVLLPTDPYLYPDSIWPNWWHKRVDFPDGGYVDYRIGPRSGSDPSFPINTFYGACQAPGGASAMFRSFEMSVISGPP